MSLETRKIAEDYVEKLKKENPEAVKDAEGVEMVSTGEIKPTKEEEDKAAEDYLSKIEGKGTVN